MSTSNLQQEILLMATTTFFRKQCQDKKTPHHQHQPHKDHFEEIYRNGLLGKILPEILERSSTGKGFYLCQTRQAEYCIQIELCSFPFFIEKQSSIDPYVFLPTRSCN